MKPQSPYGCVRFLMIVVSSLMAFALGIRGQESPPPGEEIHAVLARRTDVLATDSLRLYRATKTDQKWRLVPIPKTMPMVGQFVQPATGSTRTFFYAPIPDVLFVIEDAKTGKTRMVSGDEARNWHWQETYGLYACGAADTQWKLVSSEYDFKDVMQSADGALCAIAERPHDHDRKELIIRSVDDGKTWQDITHNVYQLGVGSPNSLFPDPDHPGLFCIGFFGMRTSMVQADDKLFQWHAEGSWGWDKRHQTVEKTFFATNFSFSGIQSISDYYFFATYENYFSFPFGDRTRIDPFELALDKDHYEFASDGPKIVTATLRFLRSDHPAAIMDLKDANDFWGLKIEAPDGTRTIIQPAADHEAKKGRKLVDYEEARQKYLQNPAILTTELIAGKSYSRVLDLNDFHALSKAGVYKVQLIYACPFWAAGEGRSRWCGSFGGAMIAITVR